MNFVHGKDLLEICERENKKISRVMLERELELGHLSEDEIIDKLAYSLEIMKNAAHGPLTKPQKSLGGLIGGEGKKITDYAESNKTYAICGDSLTRAIAYSMAVLEVNGAMGLIVAAPTAGSSGVVPGAILAAGETFNADDKMLLDALLNASALGYIFMKNASVSGAEAGCQAEVGAASAMAASALVEMMGGSPEQCLSAAAMALSNLLGLVCDPIAGLVESPCQSRNAIGVANAYTCAQIAMSGVMNVVPFDEMADAMYKVGCALPMELRETALGGCAATPTGCAHCKK